MESNSQSYSLNNLLTSFVISSQLEVRETKRIPLLTLNMEPMEYSLSQEAQNYLSSLKGKCYVISVSGKPMVGKSSLLNLLISLLKKDASQEDISYQDIYPIGDRKRGTTQDVDMYCLTVKDKSFIFLDIEGDGDPHRKDVGSWIYANLLQTAVGVSHVHLYNYNGLPQENLLSDFELISKVVRQNRIHDHFQTKYFFLVRDHPLESEDMPAEEFEEFKAPIDERLGQSGIDYSLLLLSTPPQHIRLKNSQRSCIKSAGMLCESCRSDLFVKILLDITDKLNEHLSEVPSFQSGNHLRKALGYLIELNRRELPFYSDGGQISQRRLQKLREEEIRIQKGLLAIGQHEAQSSFYKEVQKIMNDHRGHTNQQFLDNVEKTVKKLEKDVSRMEYMIQETSKFIYRYLLNDGISILDENEKKVLWDIYITNFGDFTKEITSSFKEYDEMIEKFFENLLNTKENARAHLREYLMTNPEIQNLTFVDTFCLTNSIMLKCAGKALLCKAVLVGLGLGGGGAVAGVLLAAYKVEIDEVVEKRESERQKRLGERKDAEEQIERIEEFMVKLVDDLGESRKTLNEICSKNEGENFSLIEKISNAMDNKIKRIHLSSEDRNQLIEKMDVVENNFRRFKEFL